MEEVGREEKKGKKTASTPPARLSLCMFILFDWPFGQEETKKKKGGPSQVIKTYGTQENVYN